MYILFSGIEYKKPRPFPSASRTLQRKIRIDEAVSFRYHCPGGEKMMVRRSKHHEQQEQGFTALSEADCWNAREEDDTMIFFRETSIGTIGIEEKDGGITHVYLATDAVPREGEVRETPLLRKAFDQLELYLKGQLTAFSVPLTPEGTPFMKKVWQKLCEVPYGTTASYKDIAAAVGNVGAVRAVGMANHRNPIPIFIPCHRIIGSDGTLTGYRGGLEMKRTLLELEAQYGNS
jgi:methylated-DNA-[protein]-cysteine S-methyltransferase